MKRDYGKAAKMADGGEVEKVGESKPANWDRIDAPTLQSVDGRTGFAGGLAGGISNGRALNEYRDQVAARKAAAPAKMADGGKVKDKELGLERSSGDKVGFWERIKMGNIDQPGSRAYNELGAGRGKAERQMDQLDKDMAPARAKPVAPAKVIDDVPSVESERAGSRAVAGAPKAAPRPAAKAVAAASPKAAPIQNSVETSRGNRAPGANKLPASAPAPAAEPKPVAIPEVVPVARKPLIANPQTGGQRTLNSLAGKFGSAIENSGPVRGLRAVGNAVSSALSGGAPKALPMSPGVLRQQEEDEARRAARRNPEGMANGGMVGRKSYGKKC